MSAPQLFQTKSVTFNLCEEGKHISTQNNQVIFYSATLPRLVSSIPAGGTPHKRNKYEIQVLYQCPSSKASLNGKLVLRKKRIFIGTQGNKDALDMDCNPMIYKTQQTKGKKLIISSPKFDIDHYQINGGFLNKKFWNYNIAWGIHQELGKNFLTTCNFILDTPHLNTIPLKNHESGKICIKRNVINETALINQKRQQHKRRKDEEELKMMKMIGLLQAREEHLQLSPIQTFNEEYTQTTPQQVVHVSESESDEQELLLQRQEEVSCVADDESSSPMIDSPNEILTEE